MLCWLSADVVLNTIHDILFAEAIEIILKFVCFDNKLYLTEYLGEST